MTAGMQTGNAGRFLQNGAALRRLGGNQFADLPLPHHGWRAGAGGSVGEQQLHVAGTHILAVDAVGRPGLPLDAAGDFQQIGVVEGGRRGAQVVSENQRHFGSVTGRPPAGAGEDDVVHAGGTHRLVGAFAHHPAHGLDKVGLAAAVRADHAGQAGLDDELGEVHEGLEALYLQPFELHWRSASAPPYA